MCARDKCDAAHRPRIIAADAASRMLQSVADQADRPTDILACAHQAAYVTYEEGRVNMRDIFGVNGAEWVRE